jgi:hypothetical protein
MNQSSRYTHGLSLPPNLIGTYRSFGIGPVDQILGPSMKNQRGLARIIVIESGEELDYPIADILTDPIAT